MSAGPFQSDQLCLACGLCCSGVLFRDVELQPDDDPARLRSLGVPLETVRGKIRLRQPCAALGADCRCGIYDDRPTRCRQFDCALLKAAQAGTTEIPAALRVIRDARRRADEVRSLLRQLGDTDECLALSLRFKRARRRVETEPLTENAAQTFGELTLAVHRLNVLLSSAFYPSAID